MRCKQRRLPRAFYNRPATEVARDLLGKVLVNRKAGCSARIVEVEAYLGLEDRAAHAWRGVTPRTKVIFGPPGHAYVYLIYGMYECLNIVAEPEGSAGCVLIRALEPITGMEGMQERRPAAKRTEDLANGPGKLTLAMDIDRGDNGRDLTKGDLFVCDPEVAEPIKIAVATRIGITQDVEFPLRFFIDGNRYVSDARKRDRPQ